MARIIISEQDPVEKKPVVVVKAKKKTEPVITKSTVTPKKKVTIAPAIVPVRNFANDSIAAAKTLIESPTYKGKSYDPAGGYNKRIKRLVGSYVRPAVEEHREVADSIYAANKLKDVNYPGVSAKELNKFTNNKGKEFIENADTYQSYRKVFNKSKKGGVLNPTELPVKENAPARFGGSGRATTEKLYVTDPNLTPIKKRPAPKK